MKNSLRLLFFAIICSTEFLPVVHSLEKPKDDPVEGTIDWVYDYEVAKKKSKESGKPMFVVFRCER